MRWFCHLKGGMEVVIDGLTVLAKIKLLTYEAFENWSFDGVFEANITLKVVEYNLFLLVFLLFLLLFGLVNLYSYHFFSELIDLIFFSPDNNHRLSLLISLRMNGNNL